MKYENKDITTVKSGFIMHGVNCQQAMGSGVAQALSTKWPVVRERYMGIRKEDMKLGTIQPVRVENGLYVINCWTQDKFGSDLKIYASPFAIKQCLEAIKRFTNAIKIFDLYAPKIGCGLGGLDWAKDVEPLFMEFQHEHPEFKITICTQEG